MPKEKKAAPAADEDVKRDTSMDAADSIAKLGPLSSLNPASQGHKSLLGHLEITNVYRQTIQESPS